MTSVVTIGTFDGVHRGHQLLVSNVATRAAELGVDAVVVTFEPIPISVLRPEVYRGRICSAEDKLRYLHMPGIDRVEVIPFTRELASRTPEEFISALVEELAMIELWVGDDFALGRNRSGNVEVLRELGKSLGYATVSIERIGTGSQPISSTATRNAIESGDVSLAATLLGRPFRISGEVIHGAHLGRKIGFPTANFVPPPGMVSLADGIYASYAMLPSPGMGSTAIDSVPALRDEVHLPAMTYVGNRPTVEGQDRQIETNIFDFDREIYGQTLTVDLIQRVRADQTFDGLEPLIAQLRRDEATIRQILETHPHEAAGSP
jgi:riboflavin kinase/FMN adenylyltransferase